MYAHCVCSCSITPTRSTHDNRNHSCRNNPDSSGDPQTSPVRTQQDLGIKSRLTEIINIHSVSTDPPKATVERVMLLFSFSLWLFHTSRTVSIQAIQYGCISWLGVAHCKKYLLCSVFNNETISVRTDLYLYLRTAIHTEKCRAHASAPTVSHTCRNMHFWCIFRASNDACLDLRRRSFLSHPSVSDAFGK